MHNKQTGLARSLSQGHPIHGEKITPHIAPVICYKCEHLDVPKMLHHPKWPHGGGINPDRFEAMVVMVVHFSYPVEAAAHNLLHLPPFEKASTVDSPSFFSHAFMGKPPRVMWSPSMSSESSISPSNG